MVRGLVAKEDKQHQLLLLGLSAEESGLHATLSSLPHSVTCIVTAAKLAASKPSKDDAEEDAPVDEPEVPAVIAPSAQDESKQVR